MWKVQLLGDFEPVAVPDARRSSCPFADAVESKYRGLLEGRCEKRRRRVTLMMLGKQQAVAQIDSAIQFSERATQHPFLKELLAQPYRHRRTKRFKPMWRESQVGL